MSDTPPEIQVVLLQKEMADLRKEVQELNKEVAGLVEAWRTASGVVAFIKWLSGLTIAVGILWTAFRAKLGA